MKDTQLTPPGLTEGSGKRHDSTYECEPTPDLAKGSSTQGMTMNGNGDLSATDLENGYSDGAYKPPPPEADMTIAQPLGSLIDDEKSGGFLERDHGWER